MHILYMMKIETERNRERKREKEAEKVRKQINEEKKNHLS